MKQPFIMVVYGNREIFFSVFLAYYILVEIFFYFSGLGNFFEGDRLPAEMFAVLPDDVVAQFDTFRTDKDIVWALNEWLILTSRPPAEAADSFVFFAFRVFGHYSVPIQK